MKVKIQFLFLGLAVSLVHFFLATSITVPDEYINHTMIDPSVVSSHDHFSDIDKHCSSFLSSDSEYKPDDDTRSRLYTDLSFLNGDWEQEAGAVPLLPFVDFEMQTRIPYDLPTPLKLVSFDVRGVSPVQHFRNSISIRAHLSIGMFKDSSFLRHFNSDQSLLEPGSSVLAFSFHGIYTETALERCLCMFGNSSATPQVFLPSIRDISSGFDFNQCDKYLLILRYPKVFSLNNKAIRGELRSLYKQQDPKYFDTVYMSSQLTRQSRYEFRSNLVEFNCDSKFYHTEMMEDGAQKFSTSELCGVLDSVSRQAISVFPNYKFGGTHLEDNELITFLFGKHNRDEGSSYDNVKLIMQLIKCEQQINDAAKVFAVLRAIPAGVDLNIAPTMTGLSGLTLAVEGLWDPSRGQLCMIGCTEGVDSGLEECNARISLYFPRALAIKQRSLIFGSISSINNGMYSKFHQLFDAVVHPSYFDYDYVPAHLSYNYSKFSLASAFKSRTKLPQIVTIVQQSFLKYPSLKNGGEEPFSQLKLLSEKLLIGGYLAPNQLQNGYNSRIYINMKVLSLGPLLGNFCRQCSREIPVSQQAELTSTDILNISTHLVFNELRQEAHAGTLVSYKNISQLFLEGLYDPLVGEMHLIGCRKIATESNNAERNLDCLIEVKIQYPSDNMQWLRNPTIEITITSQRNEHDPLYFGSIRLHASTSGSLKSLENAAQRRLLEGILEILVLAIATAIISSQLLFMREQAEIIPFISSTMLFFQVLGYSLPLITHTDILFKSHQPELYTAGYIVPYIKLLKTVDSVGRTLLLAALLLTARLCRMVLDSRNNLNLQSQRPRCRNKDKVILSASVSVYALGFLSWILYGNHNQQLQHQKNAHKTREMVVEEIWMSNMEEFFRMVQDFFLLPQILSNLFWHVHVKALRKSYYMGFTVLRLLIHVYEHVRDPILELKFQEYEFVNSSDAAYSSSKFSKISVVTIMVMVMLAAVLHIQQKWKNKKLISLALNKSLEE